LNHIAPPRATSSSHNPDSPASLDLHQVSILNVRRLLQVVITLFVGVVCGAQEPVTSSNAVLANRPKIGLVLEGGAALGLAHIGVISWLEEHHIPISYIAGTSMGGLVGGMYATGKSPAEIRQLVDGISWGEVLRGETPFRDLDYRRKEDKRDYPNSLEFGLKRGVRFPEGFNAGHQVGLILDRVALPYSGIENFDELPIPFACVATDLSSGKEYVFRRGSLGTALRSTMSIPGVFTPVRIDGHIFADGGILNNLPTDVAKAMGADIVIAVHLQVQQFGPAASLSSFGVLARSLSVVIATSELRGMEKADILLTADLSGYGSQDYGKSAEIARRGYEAAQNKAAMLNKLSVDDETWQRYVAERRRRMQVAPDPQFIQVAGTKPQAAGEIQEALKSNVGKPVDHAAIDNELTKFTGVGRYSRLSYRMTEQNNRPGLVITADEKLYAPPLVQPIVIIDGSDYNNPKFKLGARITLLDVGGYRSEWRNDLIAGAENGIATEYYRPLRERWHWFVAPQAFANSSEFDVYSKDTLIAEYRNRQTGGAVDIGYQIDRRSEVRFGYRSANQNFSLQVGDPNILPHVSGRQGVTSIRYSLIGVDSPTVPRSGTLAFFRTGWYDANPGATSGFPLSELQFTTFRLRSKPSSVFFSAAGGTTYSSDKVGVPRFSLGGVRALAAYGNNELLTNQYFLFKAGYIRKLTELPTLIGNEIDFIGAYELGKAYGRPLASRLPTDVLAGIVVNTIFGPVVVGGAYGDTGHHKFFFNLGRIF
jgi:NTE family protein